ncbi:MAG: ADP-ribosylglycohydrolase family protein [Frisingicoccus sp.]|uniref:ADP-ribosylglycohydrolase family protein n=1 Tax=Frisingicoccus sp. TaxID=1918627 RepID=UPI0026387DC6|nr:ADP-ribosylglycohydrolase family protein [Frisingicoccus sp.]MDD6231376.1 ADP-ribosylglycohydrolase family protein [Frisingicoccus sp.]MDY4834821.1 ADP-ribosylglycohydrolase family protein [Frisingicoccus sp.]
MRDYNKIAGCLLGGAAGDALGYAIEFDDEKTIFSKYGEAGIQNFDLDFTSGEAIISDDTQMTLFTAEGILLADNPYIYKDFIYGVFEAYQDWYRTQMFRMHPSKKIWLSDIPELNQRRAPGNTCLSALGSGKFGGIDEPINNSKGCGGVMRVAPIGLFYSQDKLSIDVIDRFGASAAALTHGHPMGYISAAGLVHIVNLAVYKPEMSLKEIVDDMIEKVPALFIDEAAGFCIKFQDLMRKAVKLAEEKEVSDLDAIHQLGEGWVGEETLAIAIYCALRHENDFDKALTASVNHRGDSDSTGSVTGNILGAYLGLQTIPEKYLKNLELRKTIMMVAERLVDKE